MFDLKENELRELKKLYIDLHKNPEISFQEFETSKKMKAELEALNPDEIYSGFGVTGIAAVVKNGEGPVIMLRTDIDALPIDEMTELEYKSEKSTTDWFGNDVKVMHACGHDMHMTVFTGTAKKLIEHKDKWKGTLILLCQPAEELGKGAKAMIDNGLFNKVPVPDYLLAYHIWPEINSGEVGFTPGSAWAGVDTLDLIVYGEGGHGAVPQRAKDPIVLASQIVLALQTIVSREVAPFEPAVVTVGSIRGGSKHNIIPESVEMKLTLRTYSDEVRTKIIESIKRISENLARAAGISEDKLPELKGLENYHPTVVNDPKLVKTITGSFAETLGKEKVKNVPPVTVGEDFEIFRREKPEIKSAIFWLGVDNLSCVNLPEELKGKTPPLHSPYLAPDPDKTIVTGVKAMTTAVIDLFAKG
ncbi:MAG: amidohydrolase [Rhodothermaceae bacterium]